MLQDTNYVNAKGRVKVELYNEQGTFFTKEKKNLVVLDANRIIAQMMADPAKISRVAQADTGSTAGVANASGLYVFQLSKARDKDTTYEVDLGTVNTLVTFTIPNGQRITKLRKVTVGGVEQVIDQDVFIQDAEAGKVTFVVAPKGLVHIEYTSTTNPYVEVIAGTEVVVVGGVPYKRGLTPSTASQTYTVDYKTGQLFFDSVKAGVQVDYNYKIKYSLGFMGIGKKPTGLPDYQPVEFTKADKLKLDMPEEFPDCRQLISYPCSYFLGQPEIEAQPCKQLNTSQLTDKITIDADGNKIYTLPSAGVKKILEIVTVKKQGNITDEYKSHLQIKDANTAKIEFTDTVIPGDQYNITYIVQDNNDHLNYYMGESPILELVAVRHQDALTQIVTEYTNIVNRGLEIGQGDVWILNSNQGIIQFAPNPTSGPAPQTPGLLTFEYRVNSGTTVQFIADFPKGIPGPLESQYDQMLTINDIATSYALDYACVKDGQGKWIMSIERNGSQLVEGTDYTINSTGTQVQFSFVPALSDTIVLTYHYLKETHDIYQVAMFTDKVDGKMFNISGIGPITKDKNTGMRITWSVTF
jgi:hypothetical protein